MAELFVNLSCRSNLKQRKAIAIFLLFSPKQVILLKTNQTGERIYHAPWSRSYKRTRVSEHKGERWLCDKAEALAAGWRAPYN